MPASSSIVVIERRTARRPPAATAGRGRTPARARVRSHRCLDRPSAGGPRRRRARFLPLGQGRRDDVAGRQVAVRRGAAGRRWANSATYAHTTASTWSSARRRSPCVRPLDLATSVSTRRGARLHRGAGVREPLEELHERSSSARSSSGGGRTCSCTSASGRAGTVRPSPGAGRPRSPGARRRDPGSMSRSSARASRHRAAPRELGLAGVGRVRAGVEPGEVAVQRGLARPVAGGVADHQRRVDGDQAVTADVRRQGGPDRVVGPPGERARGGRRRRGRPGRWACGRPTRGRRRRSAWGHSVTSRRPWGFRPSRPARGPAHQPVAHERRHRESGDDREDHHEDTAARCGRGGADHRGRGAMRDVRDPRAAGHHHDEDALESPSHGVLGSGHQHAVAEITGDHVGRAADDEQCDRGAEQHTTGPAGPGR